MKILFTILIIWAILCGPLAGIGALYILQLSDKLNIVIPNKITNYGYKDVEDGQTVELGGLATMNELKGKKK
jgi:hypothetical protein